MRVVVFGAGGGVGGWICETLSQDPAFEVTACLRSWYSAVRLARRGVRLVRADLEDRASLPPILTGADVLVNAAMLPPSREAFLVRQLYEAAAAAGIRRFVQFSSAAVYGNLTGAITEGTPPAPNDDYSRGKAEMERLLIDAATDTPQVVILRPSIIYGPFADYWTVRYADRIAKGRWRRLGIAGEGICNLIHAQDVASAVRAAATVDLDAKTQIMNLNGPDVVTWNDYIERLGDAMGTPGRFVPHALVFRGKAFAAAAMRQVSRLRSIRSFYGRSTGSAKSAMKSARALTMVYPNANELELLRRKARYMSDKSNRVLGIVPSISLDAGLKQSVEWCRVHGVV